MSIESAKAFIEKMKADKEFAAKLGELKDPTDFLHQAGYDFTPEELAQVKGALADSDLEGVSGGAYPTAVNNQITDSVT